MFDADLNAELLNLVDKLDELHHVAEALPQEQHKAPPESLADEAYALGARALELGFELAPMLPPTPPDATEWLLEDDPRTILSGLVLDLARAGPLIRSGCARPLRPRAQCYVPLLAALATDARRLAAALRKDNQTRD